MLYIKECKKVLLSLTFLLYAIAVFAMYYTQFHSELKTVPKPVPGQESYGMVVKEDPDILMPAAIDGLIGEYLSDTYVTYPLGFYKSVHLNEDKKEKMADIIQQVSGITREQLDSFTDYDEGEYYMDENNVMMYREPNLPEVNIPQNMTYEHFRELMREADSIIGGGSKYSDDSIVGQFSLVSTTYDDALEEYTRFINDDKITGAYARLYCDYVGIVVSILPVFVAVFLSGLDKKSRMNELAYSRRISSARLIFTRYFALVSVMLIPVVLTAAIAQIKVTGMYSQSELDGLAFSKYAVMWLVPNVMTATAVGMLITELSSGLIAIFVQGLWWFSSAMNIAGGLTGNIGKFTLVVRNNSLLSLSVFMDDYSNFVFNRVFFTVASIAAILLTSFIYEQKRRGRINGFGVLVQNFKHKFKA